jgi:hypothetical protein
VQVVPPLAHVQPVPAIETSVNPLGTASVTVTVPLVGPAAAALLTVTEYVAPFCPCVKLPVCVLVMLKANGRTPLASARTHTSFCVSPAKTTIRFVPASYTAVCCSLTGGSAPLGLICVHAGVPPNPFACVNTHVSLKAG